MSFVAGSVRRRPRGFTIVEVVVVGAVAAVVAATAAALTVKTSNDLENAQNRLSILEFVQRERNSHVSRAVEQEVVVICAAVGAGPCTAAGGDTLVAYRTPAPPVTFPNPLPAELARARFTGAQITFAPGPALFVDAFARSVDAGAVPTNTVLNMMLRGGVTDDILLRLDGVAVPSFEAPSAIEVTPIISDMGARATPNPTPQGRPATTYRSRKVFVE